MTVYKLVWLAMSSKYSIYRHDQAFVFEECSTAANKGDAKSKSTDDNKNDSNDHHSIPRQNILSEGAINKPVDSQCQ